MLRIFEKIVDNYKVDPGKLDSLVLRKGLMKLIRSVEEIGRYKNLEVISQADLDD
jgi:hypothetical protein